MAQLVKRVTLSGSEMAVEFPEYLISEFLVKNYSDGDIYVSLATPLVTSESIKITSAMYQVIFNNDNYPDREEYKRIYLMGTGEVEVDVTCYRKDPDYTP